MQMIADLVTSACVVMCGSASLGKVGLVTSLRDLMFNKITSILHGIRSFCEAMLNCSNGDYKTDGLVPTGIVWDGCKAIKAIQWNNFYILASKMKSEMELVQDMLSEMEDFQVDMDNDTDTAEQQDNVEIVEQQWVGGSEDGFDDDFADFDDVADEDMTLNMQEYLRVEYSKGIIQAAKMAITKTIKGVYHHRKEVGEIMNDDQLALVETDIERLKQFSALCDTIGSYLYAPQDVQAIHENVQQLVDITIALVEDIHSEFDIADKYKDIWDPAKTKMVKLVDMILGHETAGAGSSSSSSSSSSSK
eukprot:TRINITY_DN7147_c0_g1_i1.p1 TRINITY_DN7147_c0_g1~~TRINITY_DN7147_c0_g1_i1.p1  ORF type:complete len:305 (-),score=127.69 TRINITY_DN7147_c0_g1_i1:29-943(-)